MRRIEFCSAIIVVLLVTSSAATFAQQGPVTGTPNWGSFDTRVLETINLGNLNYHFAIPVLHKTGRGLPFNFDLVYDNSIWYPVTSGTTTTWTPLNVWGWQTQMTGSTGMAGYIVPKSSTLKSCRYFNPDLRKYYTEYYEVDTYTGFVDRMGTFHAAPATYSYFGDAPDCFGGGDSYSGGTARDGSGYYMNVGDMTVTGRDGSVISLGNNSGTVKDSNGNQLSTAVNSGTTTFTDTTGNVALTVTGGAPYPLVYTYTGPGGPANVTVNYTAKTVCTNFNAPNILEYPATVVNLVSRITLPDNTSYVINYEPVPTTPAPGAGCGGAVTGRIASITLPTGGTIAYAYTGGSNGIFADGTTPVLTRTESTGGTWTYARTESPYTTTLVDAVNNQTVINFQVDATGYYYETNRQVYQGSSPLLETIQTCYNGSSFPCTTTAVTPPITRRSVQVQPANGATAKTDSFYDSAGYGLPVEVDEYDFGASTPTRKTVTAYAMYDRPSQITVQDGAGTIAAQTKYQYDQTALISTTGTPQQAPVSSARGNATTISRLVSGAKYLTQSLTYMDTGNISQITDANGALTTYTYAACGNSFPTNMATIGLSRQQTWDCNGGVPTSIKSANGQSTSYTYDQSWRLTQTSYPDGGQTVTQYNLTTANPSTLTSITAATKIDASNTASSTTVLDGFGRVTQTQVTSDPSGTDYIDTVYDQLGRVYTVSNPYRTKSESTYGLTTYNYDALGRVVTTIMPDSNTNTAGYVANVVTTTDATNRQRQLTYDGLGRLTSVVEPNASTGSLTSGSYTTTYAYNALDKLTSVQQNGSDSTKARNRGYTYDLLGRLTSESNPETGTINYTYDSVTGSASNGDLVQMAGPAPNQTGSTTVAKTYSYDYLHRLTNISYSDGTTPAVNITYDQTSANGHALTYPKGLPTTACAGTICSYYSYDQMGRIQDLWQMAGSTSVHYDYNLAGLPTHYTNGVTINFYQTFNAVGQVTKLTSGLVDATHPGTLANNLGYGPTGALSSIQHGVQNDSGNGLLETHFYNNRLQPSAFSVKDPTNNSNVLTQAFTFSDCNAKNNGNLTNYAASGSQSFSRAYSYDQLNRLASTTGDCAINWTYDAWGNRLSQSASGICTNGGGNGGVNTANQLGGFNYDAAGNMMAVPNSMSNQNVTYDAENRVIWVGPPNTSGSIQYSYDAAGQRVQKSTYGGSASSQIRYVFDASGHVVAETDGNGGWQAGYVYLNSQLEAIYRNSTTYFVHADHLGSTRLWTNIDRSVNSSLDYQPYGEALNRNPNNDFQFTGQEHDIETSTDHFLYREYSSNLGRWTKPDSAGLAAVDIANPQSWNRYAYVSNSPLRGIDPSGLFVVDCSWDPCGPFGGGYAFGGGQYGGGSGAGFTGTYGGGFAGSTEGSNTFQSIIGGPLGRNANPAWYQKMIDCAANPGSCDTTAQNASGIYITVYCGGTYSGGTITSLECAPPGEAIPGSLPYIFSPNTRPGALPGTNPPRTPNDNNEQLWKGLKLFYCGTSPANNIKNWTLEGMAKGAVWGGLAGGITGTVLGTPVGGLAGAVAGAVFEGTVGGMSGVILGTAASGICYATGAY